MGIGSGKRRTLSNDRKTAPLGGPQGPPGGKNLTTTHVGAFPSAGIEKPTGQAGEKPATKE